MHRDGGAPCPVPRTEHSEVGVFLHSWCGAGLGCYYFILALAKTVTPAVAPGGAGAACAANHRTVIFSQKILAAQKPMTYTDLLATVFYSDNPRIVFISCLPTIAIISTTSLFIL